MILACDRYAASKQACTTRLRSLLQKAFVAACVICIADCEQQLSLSFKEAGLYQGPHKGLVSLCEV